MSHEIFIGVDMAKDKFDVALPQEKTYRYRQFVSNKEGFKSFLTSLKQITLNEWVCMEATGHYSEVLAEYLTHHGLKVSIINPWQIKNFARLQLTRNKNDKVDARLIARYGQMMKPPVFQPRSASQKDLKDLVKLLDTLKAQKVQLNNQAQSTQGNIAKKVVATLLKELSTNIAKLEQRLTNLVANEEKIYEQVTLLTSIKGIGHLTAYKILAQVPRIEQYARAKQFAAAIGITPKQHQSGKFQGKTTISRLGDARLRKALYMAALVAKRYNPLLKSFAQRLQQRGKAPKAIICALMRKLAHIIFGVLKHRKPFDASFASNA